MISYKVTEWNRIVVVIGELEVGFLTRKDEDKDFVLETRWGLTGLLKNEIKNKALDGINGIRRKFPRIINKCPLCGSSDFVRPSVYGSTCGRILQHCSLCGWWMWGFWEGGSKIRSFIQGIEDSRRIRKRPGKKDQREWSRVSVRDRIGD